MGMMATESLALRTDVSTFAAAMEMKLRKHDDWGNGWKSAPIDALMRDLSEHYFKLASMVFSEDAERGDVLGAAADIGNFAMFIADVFVPHSERQPANAPGAGVDAESAGALGAGPRPNGPVTLTMGEG
jgi:hypothetical protein